MDKHKFIFIGGLHRSGTTILARCLQDHPLISGISGTGVTHDEGQHVQSVYPAAKLYGGAGIFGFHPETHITEESPLVSEENRIKLFAEWEPYWDTGRPFLLEKSPPNLLKSRFLQAMFPSSYFIFILRHPAAVAFATQKWSKTSIPSLIEHWVICHETLRADTQHLKNFVTIQYEEFVKEPQAHLDRIYAFLGTESQPFTRRVEPKINEKYFQRWNQWGTTITGRFRINRLSKSFEARINTFGYSLSNLENE